MKLKSYGKAVDGAGRDRGEVLVFYCPGCKYDHPFHVGGDNAAHPQWEFNGDMERPTFSPSLIVNRGTPKVCHLFLRDGKIEFLSDCWHSLAGQRVELPEME